MELWAWFTTSEGVHSGNELQEKLNLQMHFLIWLTGMWTYSEKAWACDPNGITRRAR